MQCDVFRLATRLKTTKFLNSLSKILKSAGKIRMNPHGTIDARSLAMDRLIAQHLRHDPSLLGKARKVLERWLQSCDGSVRPTLEEWRSILDGPFDLVLEALEGDDEKSVRLRQSSPFCGILIARTHDQRAA